jgi:hypothetical protein
MRLPGVITLVVTAALAAALASNATAHSPNGTATYLRVRPDLRMCPSPMCGGWWAGRVNRDTIVCGNGLVVPECYAAMLDFSALELADERRARIEQVLANGTALLRGRLARGTVVGPSPSRQLDTLVVTEIWLRSGQARSRGLAYRVEDNGVRCIRAPCFSLHASVLNTAAHRNVSSLDLEASGASQAAVRRARAALDGTGVMVEGRVVAGGPAGDRTLRASAFWLRAA